MQEVWMGKEGGQFEGGKERAKLLEILVNIKILKMSDRVAANNYWALSKYQALY